MNRLPGQPLQLILALLCLALPISAAAFPPANTIGLERGQNGPFTPPAAGPDWYSFTLDSFSAVTLYSTRPAAAVEGVEPGATLMTSDGKVVAQADDNAPNHQFRIEKNLPAGRYYLKIDAPLLLPRDDESSNYEIFWQ